MNLKNLKQFKMLGGEELLAEVLSWPDPEDEDYSLLIRHALIVVSGEDFIKGIRYYTFKPFMLYQDRPSQNLHLNLDHVTCVAIPNESLASQWVTHIRKLAEDLNEDIFDEVIDGDSDTPPNILPFKPRMH